LRDEFSEISEVNILERAGISENKISKKKYFSLQDIENESKNW